MLAPRPTPKLEDHPSSAVRDCLFNLFTATLHIGGRSSIRNPRTRHAVVTGTHIHGLVHPWKFKLDSSENVTKFHRAFVQSTCSLAYSRCFVCMADVNFDFLKGPLDLRLNSQSHTCNVLSFREQCCDLHTDFLSMF